MTGVSEETERGFIVPSDISREIAQSMPGMLDKLFTRNIFLLKTSVTDCENRKVFAEHLNSLEPGTKLALVRELENAHDKRAISVRKGNIVLGYISREQNVILSHLMDAGKYLYATADSILTDTSDPDFAEEALTISVYMQD